MAKKATVKRKKKKVILPKVMSELIGIALADIRKAEKLPKKFVVDMGDWYDPKSEVKCETEGGVVLEKYNTCVLCAAGSVMAFSLANENQKKQVLAPMNFPENAMQLYAIDSLRNGYVVEAADRLDVNLGALDFRTINIPEYERENPEPFHRAMTALQKKLAKAGL